MANMIRTVLVSAVLTAGLVMPAVGVSASTESWDASAPQAIPRKASFPFKSEKEAYVRCKQLAKNFGTGCEYGSTSFGIPCDEVPGYFTMVQNKRGKFGLAVCKQVGSSWYASWRWKPWFL